MEKMRDKTFSVCSFRGVEVKYILWHALVAVICYSLLCHWARNPFCQDTKTDCFDEENRLFSTTK